MSLLPFQPETVHRRVLPNGLRVLVRRDASAPVVAIVTYVSAGYFDETDDVAGIAHVLEHMYFKGTPTRGVGEIARQTKAVGGYLNAATIYDHTVYYTVLPSSRFADGLAIQADAYARSLIDSDELAREIEVIVQEAKRKADNPPAVAVETLYELLHDTHRMRRWRIGREEGLRTFTRDSLVGFYRNFYHPGNTVLSIVGDVDEEAAFAEVEREYGALSPGSPVRNPGPAEREGGGFRYREMSGDVRQTQLAFGWRTPDAMSPDTPLLDLVAAMLASGRASRLYRAVRERKHASSITAYNYTPTELGVFVIHAETPPETTLEAARTAWDQVRRVREGEIGAYELERAKRIYESRWLRRLEDMEGQANYLAEWEAMGDWEMGGRYLERVMTASAEHVTEVARRWLSPDRAGVLIYRPESAGAVADSTAAMRASLEDARPADVAPSEPYAASPSPTPVDPPALEREESGILMYRSAGEVPLLVRRKPAAPLVHMGVFALGGPSDEPPELAGLSSMMARSAVKGTRRRTALQIAEEAEMLGGSIGYSVGSDSVGWSISVPAAHAVAAAELLGDVVQYATFPEDAVETERAVSIAEVIALRDDMYRYPLRLANGAAFEGHPYGTPASGTEDSLARVTRRDLEEWHQARILRGATAIAVVGDADPAELAAMMKRALPDLRYGSVTALPAPPWPATERIVAERRDREQTALVMMFPGPGRADPERYAAAMIAGVASGLGGRFFDELRDKQSLSYTVHAFSSEKRAAGVFAAYMATSPEKEEAARQGLLREFRRLCEEPVSQEELDRAKTYAIGVHQIHLQSGGAVLGEMLDAWLLGDLSDISEHETRIRAVTAAGMQAVARKYFDPGRRVEGIVRGGGAVGG